MSRKFLIDTDTASDDAVALIMALRSREIEVVAITVVSGNVPVRQGIQNALLTVELCGAETPVYGGAEVPLARPLIDAAFFHGRDGLGDRGYGPPRGEAAPGLAADVLVEQIRAHPGIVLITLGPLTNVALALERDPEIAGLVGRCVVMGGAPCCVGNVTPAAEYNIWVDPEAARRVFHSGLPIEMVGWHLCRLEANLLRQEMDLVRSFGTVWGDFTLDCNETAIEANRLQSGDPGLALPDPVAMAIAPLHPQLATLRRDRNRQRTHEGHDRRRCTQCRGRRAEQGRLGRLDPTQTERDRLLGTRHPRLETTSIRMSEGGDAGTVTGTFTLMGSGVPVNVPLPEPDQSLLLFECLKVEMRAR